MSVHISDQIIKKDWIDYNNHMNMAYYVLIFDDVWETILNKFQMGGNSAKSTNMSTMVVETHTTYNNEVKLGDEVEINLTFLDHGLLVAQELAHVLSGGDTTIDKTLSEDDLYKLELDAFMRLIETKETQDRIKHTLATGKPLVN